MALDIPADAREALAEWRDRALGGQGELRPIAAGALHVTLCFLGWRPERDIDRIAELTAAACTGLRVPVLRAVALVPLPPRRPRLFAADLDDREGDAAAVQGAVSRELSAARLYEPERRPFWPHLTMARVKRGERASLPAGLPAPPEGPFRATEVTLYRSTLRPQGAVYDPLAQTVLGA